MVKKKFFYLLWIMFCIGGAFLLIEVCARIAGIKPLPPAEYNTAFWIKNDQLGYTAFPNTKWSFIAARADADTSSGSIFVRKIGTTNEFGLRPSITNGACAACPVILTIGDSVTFNAESNDDETWPEVMAATLKRKGYEYRVQNFGMSGYSSVQSYLALKDAFIKVKGIDVVVYAFVMNDIPENFEKNDIRRPYFDDSLTIKPPLDKPEWDKAFNYNKNLENLAFIRHNLSMLRLIKRILRSGSLFIDTPPKTDVSVEGYMRTWKSRIPVMKKIQTDFLEAPRAFLLQSGMRESIRLMSEECIKHNAKFIVMVAPMLQFSNSEKAKVLARQSGMSEQEFTMFLSNHDKLYSKIKEFTLDAKGVFLDISPMIFNEMSYREYVCHPDDLHYSASANKKVGGEAAKELIDWLNKKHG